MPSYILPHTIPQEDKRLTIMSRILDPNTFFRLEQVGIEDGWRCLEVGAGNGSVSYWLASKGGAIGRVVSTDIETNLLERLDLPNLEVRKLDIVNDTIESSAYDLVFTRATLHHLPERFTVIGKLIGAVKPGGYLVLEEPDFHPFESALPSVWRDFWSGYITWAAMKGIDNYIGKKLPGKLQELGLEDVQAHGETLLFNGGSEGAEYFKLLIAELGNEFIDSGFISADQIREVSVVLENPRLWTMNISFITVTGRKPA